MSSLFEKYSEIYKKLKAAKDKFDSAQRSIDAASARDTAEKELHIERLQDLLVKVDDYMAKVESYRKLAEEHIKSRNILTITPRELNFGRMRDWSSKINPGIEDDPYAQRVYVLAKCNEMYLEQKKRQFERKIVELQQSDEQASKALIEAASRVMRQQEGECLTIIESREFLEFAEELQRTHKAFTDPDRLQTLTEQPFPQGKTIGLGGYALPFPVLGSAAYRVKVILPDHFDAEAGSLLLPVELDAEKPAIISVACTAGREKRLYRAIQNYLLNVVASSPVGENKIYVLDALHYNNTSLGALRPLVGSVVMEEIPRDSEAVADTLRQIVSEFSDIDETIGVEDSITEFNKSAKPEERIPRKTLVLIGYPTAFSSDVQKLINRILINAERYGVSLIVVNTQYTVKKNDSDSHDIPVELAQGYLRVRMFQQKTLIRFNSESEFHFRWYEFTNPELNPAYLNAVKERTSRALTLGTEYIKRIDMEHVPPYERGKKSIVLPFGVDSRDEVHSISFDNENFAAYLMGASGSGKSTMLHTLITGILRDYHPDDVELWLADFKMSEFAQYMDPLPPHVKYVLLDESPELVYDLLDQLTEKMMERQRFFMKHRDMKKVENVPSDVYMPIIFVILDEFSIMSQAVSESEAYKIRLQNLLAKGRALGIKFIFSSQTFTKGVAGLTQTAKDQVQTRIAMKNSYNEINETLELTSGTRTEQVKNWMEALPPHFTLMKYREGDHFQVKKLQVMYFKGKGEEALEPQRKLIRQLNRMRKVSLEEYSDKVLDAYVDKKPVIVDGNSYKAFQDEKIRKLIAEYRKENSGDLSADDTVITFGAPRRMVNAKFAVISNESRENLLLIARGAEQACGMSLILTAMKTFVLQGGNIQIWAYSKNRIYKAYKDSHFSRYAIAEGMSEICAAILSVREKIARKEAGNDLIVMLGMEQICNDFDLIDFGGAHAPTVKSSSINAKQYEATSEEDLAQVNEVQDLYSKFAKEYDVDALEDRLLEEGKTTDEITAETARLYQEYLEKLGLGVPKEASAEGEASAQQKSSEKAVEEESEDNDDASYNAAEDFKYIIKQGSRFGYHFLLCLNDLSDLKVTHLQQDFFRHKLVFQISPDDSIALFASKVASRLPEHICQYSNSLEQYSLRPFIHDGVTWDGWDIDEKGEATNTILL